ncbi:Helix-turn-helix domain-containing protein (plasmid) [Rhodovastum atsumiense]|uniref:Helix-turn-helix domain-containing protein n=1 Tax=Rhodovastum atsumiense TaxID=504468 RepID=A0A5M6IK28_9PROT|nr:helix-turn-helix domain-containing protein [Rhodovastum atsumiense]KAA5608601.1 helix-turn-helix domain-containing protein [Rhodovastum atsumiense]CAH2605876.1 Helix-turn-helix domain-containing protein [Rhodovastum atsumiense]
MDSSLRERFARLGPIRAVDRMSSGLPAVFVLRLPQNRATPKTIDGALALARRGLSLLRAKRAMEELLMTGRAFVDLPTVEDRAALATELTEAGIAAAPLDPPTLPDIRALRTRLRLTREQFATRYGLDVESVRNWEAGRREPGLAARSYLRAIANDPECVEQAYAPTPVL